MTDVRLYHTPDGGGITITNGQPEMSDGLETAAYLSLFGGNEQDVGGDAGKPYQWWGNLSENDPAKQYRSETQALLNSLPAIPMNLQRIKDAAGRDLAWMVGAVASSLDCSVSIPQLDWVRIVVQVEIEGKKFPVTFDAEWRGRAERSQ